MRCYTLWEGVAQTLSCWFSFVTPEIESDVFTIHRRYSSCLATRSLTHSLTLYRFAQAHTAASVLQVCVATGTLAGLTVHATASVEIIFSSELQPENRRHRMNDRRSSLYLDFIPVHRRQQENSVDRREFLARNFIVF